MTGLATLLPLAGLALPLALWPALRRLPLPAIWLALADALVLITLSVRAMPAPTEALPAGSDSYFLDGSALYLRQLALWAGLWALLALPTAAWFPWRRQAVSLGVFALLHPALVFLALPRLLARLGIEPYPPAWPRLELAALQLGTLVLPLTVVLLLVSLAWHLRQMVRGDAP